MSQGAIVRCVALVWGACSAALTQLPGTRDAAPRRNVILALSYVIGLVVLGGLVGQIMV